jgi:hypothetical protein
LRPSAGGFGHSVSGEQLPWMKPSPLARLPDRGVAVLVQVAGVDPDDVGLGAVLGARGAVEVELLLEGGVRQQRRHGDAPPVLGRERVRAIRGAAQEDAELPGRKRHHVRVVDVEIRAVVGEALLPERREEQVDRLLVARPRMLVERLPGRQWDPPVAAADAPLVAAAREDVGRRDRARQHHRVVVGERVQHRAEADLARPLRSRGEQRSRIGGDGELRVEEMLDRRVAVVAEPVGVHDLLEHLGVQLLRRLAGMELELRVQAESHRIDLL